MKRTCLFVLLAGCASNPTDWTKDGYPATRRDIGFCRRDQPGLLFRVLGQHNFEECMKEKGFTKIEPK